MANKKNNRKADSCLMKKGTACLEDRGRRKKKKSKLHANVSD